MPNLPDPLQELRDVHMPDPSSLRMVDDHRGIGYCGESGSLGEGLPQTDSTSAGRVGSTRTGETTVCETFR
jgi:hypothetical protein